jgi:hypothetical protein
VYLAVRILQISSQMHHRIVRHPLYNSDSHGGHSRAHLSFVTYDTCSARLAMTTDRDQLMNAKYQHLSILALYLLSTPTTIASPGEIVMQLIIVDCFSVCGCYDGSTYVQTTTHMTDATRWIHAHGSTEGFISHDRRTY